MKKQMIIRYRTTNSFRLILTGRPIFLNLR